MSKNIVFEGWLTKSPPTRRVWKTKWRRRWFALRHSGELPGQYFLDYYADRNRRRLKGTINLDLCEQVDAGLLMERTSDGSFNPKFRGSLFIIHTQLRTYHLEADNEADMAKWVTAICRVCGLQPKDNTSEAGDADRNDIQMTTRNERSNTPGPYIPISECITGVRKPDPRQTFTFDPTNIIISARRGHQMYMSQPHIRHNAEFSENDSNLSDDDCRSLNASHSNIRHWSASSTYTKSAQRPSRIGQYHHGPPVPPRPPKTFAMTKEAALKEKLLSARAQDKTEIHESIQRSRRVSVITHEPPRRLIEVSPSLRAPARVSQSVAPPSPARQHIPNVRFIDDEEDVPAQPSSQYCNLISLPPVVDRNLKPRHTSHTTGPVNNLGVQFQTVVQINRVDEVKTADKLQYLDLDLTPRPESEQGKSTGARKKTSTDDTCVYRTVDFLKTEAFNITRQDAEAFRSSHHP